jgi:hypothetical protein
MGAAPSNSRLIFHAVEAWSYFTPLEALLTYDHGLLCSGYPLVYKRFQPSEDWSLATY